MDNSDLHEAWQTISTRVLEQLVWTYPTTTLAMAFGVSDVAVAKKCKRRGVEKPPRGFWRRVHCGRLTHPSGDVVVKVIVGGGAD